jgi:hypothetical protein
LSTITPLSTSPAPPPIPNVAEISPMPVATRSGGNSSRMIPKASGNTAAAMPWIARPAIRTSIECESAQTSEPSAKTESAITSMRSLPNMSPSRPTIGVETDAVSRKPVSTKVTVVVEVPNSSFSLYREVRPRDLRTCVRALGKPREGSRHAGCAARGR